MRQNIVLTTRPGWKGCMDVTRADSLEHALALSRSRRRVCIIGGANVYAQALPLADVIHLTVLDQVVQGDAYFPPISDRFEEVHREPFNSKSGNGFSGNFLTLRPKK